MKQVGPQLGVEMSDARNVAIAAGGVALVLRDSTRCDVRAGERVRKLGSEGYHAVVMLRAS
jgi:hypothetical protein